MSVVWMYQSEVSLSVPPIEHDRRRRRQSSLQQSHNSAVAVCSPPRRARQGDSLFVEFLAVPGLPIPATDRALFTR